jgi:preprotein translocase subunit SecA
LEYDDVMNKQRNVVYGKRNHALFGERLALDLDNSFYSVAANMVNDSKETADVEKLQLAALRNFGMETAVTKEELEKNNGQVTAEKIYQEAIATYSKKKATLGEQTMPLISNIRKEQGNHIENVAVPFTDGQKGIQALANLDKYLETNGLELGNALERSITLSTIDDAWKEHLRAMDDLRQSVQTAGYEQKDPLVIYKIEAFDAFKKMDDKVNKDIVSFLCHAGIPMEQTNAGQIKEGREQKTDMRNMNMNKAAVDAAGEDYAANENDYFDPSAGAVKQEPVRVDPKIGRNDACPCGSGKKYKNCHG